MKCPVCKNEIQEIYSVCPICNYFGLNKDFINIEDAIEWEKSVLTYYRALWLRKQAGQNCCVNLESKEAVEIFGRYFTNERHKYRILEDAKNSDYIITVNSEIAQKFYGTKLSGAKFAKALDENSPLFSAPRDIVEKAADWDQHFTGLEINTKYLKVAFMSEGNVHPQYYLDYGHEYYQVDYTINVNIVSIYMKPTTNDDKEYICSIIIKDDSKRSELLTVLEFLKSGNGHFIEPFDESVLCVNELANEELTYDTYFRNGSIKPLVFYAEVVDYNEDNEPNEMIEDHGLCKVSLSVSCANSKVPPNIMEMFENGSTPQLRIDKHRILKPNLGFGYHSWTTLDKEKSNYDFYLDRRCKTLYWGTLQEYTKFKFEDELLMQQVFNYLVILGTYWIM